MQSLTPLLLCRSADAEVLAPSLDFLSPKDYHYLLYGLSNLIEANDTLLTYDVVPEVQSGRNAERTALRSEMRVQSNCWAVVAWSERRGSTRVEAASAGVDEA